MINRCKIKGTLYFRYFTGNAYKQKKGLYIGDIASYPSDWDRLTDKDILRISEWLSRYTNIMVHKKPNEIFVGLKANAREIIRNIDKLEAEKKNE